MPQMALPKGPHTDFSNFVPSIRPVSGDLEFAENINQSLQLLSTLTNNNFQASPNLNLQNEIVGGLEQTCFPPQVTCNFKIAKTEDSSNFNFCQEGQLSGPWLLDDEHLEALDAVCSDSKQEEDILNMLPQTPEFHTMSVEEIQKTLEMPVSEPVNVGEVGGVCKTDHAQQSPVPSAPDEKEPKKKPRRGRAKRLTPEERRLRRREQNRMAARRSREKKRNSADIMSQDYHVLVSSNHELRQQVSQLQRERDELQSILEAHKKHCQLREL